MGRSEGRSTALPSLEALIAWLALAPEGTSLPAATMHHMLTTLAAAAPSEPQPASESVPATWRERLWVVPAETRLGVHEAAEALGRSVSFIYRHTSEKACGPDRMPHRKLDGELLFVVGEIRSWLADHEETITAGRIVPALSLSPRRAS